MNGGASAVNFRSTEHPPSHGRRVQRATDLRPAVMPHATASHYRGICQSQQRSGLHAAGRGGWNSDQRKHGRGRYLNYPAALELGCRLLALLLSHSIAGESAVHTVHAVSSLSCAPRLAFYSCIFCFWRFLLSRASIVLEI